GCSEIGLIGCWATRWRVFREKRTRAPIRAARARLRGTTRLGKGGCMLDAMETGVWVESKVEWILAHEELERLAKERAELDGREGLALLRAFRAEVHRHLGYASFAQYVEKLFGYNFRTTDDKLRTAIALQNLPEISRALNQGALCWSAARELARVATRATEREWLEAARGKTVR